MALAVLHMCHLGGEDGGGALAVLHMCHLGGEDGGGSVTHVSPWR
jgi:hypothetical protein